MLGTHEAQRSIFQMVTIEELVPEDYILRKVDQAVDFSFIRDRVRDLYSPHKGRPSADPELVFRMVAISYFCNVPENQLEDEIRMHAGYRWFCRLDLHDRVPDRTTLVKLRNDRWGPGGVYDAVLEEILAQCRAAGLVPEKEDQEVVAVDGTVVKARAAMSSLERIEQPVSIEEHRERIQQADAAEAPSPENSDASGSSRNPAPDQSSANDAGPGATDAHEFAASAESTSNGTQDAQPSSTQGDAMNEPSSDSDHRGKRRKKERLSNKTHRSRTDPDARLYAKGPRDGAALRYFVHSVIDPRSGVILATRASICSGYAEREASLQELTNLVLQGYKIEYLVADGGYTGAEYSRDIMDLGIVPLVPAYGKEQPLPEWKLPPNSLEQNHKRIKKLKAVIAHNTVLQMRESDIYEELFPLRQRIEHTWAEAKTARGMSHARGYGLQSMDIQAKMTAAVQNMKRLVQWMKRKPKSGGQVVALNEGKGGSKTRATTLARPFFAPMARRFPAFSV